MVDNDPGVTGMKYDPWLDDGVLDRASLQQAVFLCLEMLWAQCKWERLVHLALRFLAWSGYA